VRSRAPGIADLTVGSAREHGLVAEAARRSLEGRDDAWLRQVRALGAHRIVLRHERGLAELRRADAMAVSRWRLLHHGAWWVLLGAVPLLALVSAAFLLPSRFRSVPATAQFVDVAPSLLVVAAALQLVTALVVPTPRRAPAAAWAVSGGAGLFTVLAALSLVVRGGEVRALDGGSAVLVWTLAAGVQVVSCGVLVLRTRTPRHAAWHDAVRRSRAWSRDIARRIPAATGTGSEAEVARSWKSALTALEGEVGPDVAVRALAAGPRGWLLACALAANVPS
jgi:hypothetical protein